MGIVDDLKIGDHIADLLAVIEAVAADYPVRHAAARKRLLDGVRLGVGAVEHGKIRVFAPVGYSVEDGLSNKRSLVALAVTGVDDDLLALRILRPKGLALANGII